MIDYLSRAISVFCEFAFSVRNTLTTSPITTAFIYNKGSDIIYITPTVNNGKIVIVQVYCLHYLNCHMNGFTHDNNNRYVGQVLLTGQLNSAILVVRYLIRLHNNKCCLVYLINSGH